MPRRALLTVTGVVLAAVALFLAYLRQARAVTVNSDGASNALQAWDLFHGNLLLSGWTLSDVSFYPTELVQYGLVQLVTGVTPDQIHVAAALTWTLVVLLAAWLARRPDAGAPGAAGWLPLAIAVAILVLPSPGVSYQTLLSSPNHTGSAVPLLIAWLLADRARDRLWMPPAVAVVLAWGALGDPLITFVGAVPLIAVTAVRALRARSFRGADARLAVAGVASVVLSHAAIWLIERAGGFHAPRPPIELSPVAEWPSRAAMVGRMVAILYGTARPGVQAPWVEAALPAVHLPGLLLAMAALVITAVAFVRGTADRLDAILAAAIACDLGAEIVSTLPIDLLATREIVPILPMSAVLAGRTAVRLLLRRRLPAAAVADDAGDAAGPEPRIADPAIPSPRGRRILAGVGGALLAAVLAVQLVTLAGYTPPRAEPIEGQEAADWLVGQNLRYGLGSYWVSNNITVGTGRRVTVVPTLSANGKLTGMCWQTHADMYDPSVHDARFVLLENERPMYGTPADVLKQYGVPVTRKSIGRYTIFVYDRNLLEGFAGIC